jgi:hypothetical protein
LLALLLASMVGSTEPASQSESKLRDAVLHAVSPLLATKSVAWMKAFQEFSLFPVT